MEAERDPAKEAVLQRRATPSAQAESPAPIHPIMALQQQAGNQAVQGLLRSGHIQAKLTISSPGSAEEREAEQVSAHVMSDRSEGEKNAAIGANMAPSIQRRPAIDGTQDNLAVGENSASVDSMLHRNGGQPLDAESRSFFEPRLGHDLSDVRIHTGADAARSAESLQAQAYTHGSDVVFASGQYSPQSSQGRTLLAHELTHTIQQKGNHANRTIARAPAKNVIQADPIEIYSYTPAYKQEFLNKCAEANTLVDLAERRFSVYLSAIAIAYSTAWRNHADMLNSLEASYKLFDEIAMAAFLGLIPGSIGGALGKTMKDLKTADFIVDGIKDLTKAVLRSPVVNTVVPKPSGGAAFKPAPTNPLEWKEGISMRSQQELSKATESILDWQHAMNNNENVDLRFDPVEKVKAALNLEGESLLTIKPIDIPKTTKQFEGAWLMAWIDKHWFQTAIHLIPVMIGSHKEKLAKYGESLGIPAADVMAKLNAVYNRDYEANNKAAIQSGHPF